MFLRRKLRSFSYCTSQKLLVQMELENMIELKTNEHENRWEEVADILIFLHKACEDTEVLWF